LDKARPVFSRVPKYEVDIHDIPNFVAANESTDLGSKERAAILTTDSCQIPYGTKKGGRVCDDIDLDGFAIALEEKAPKGVTPPREVFFDMETLLGSPQGEVSPESHDRVRILGKKVEVVGPPVLKVGQRKRCATSEIERFTARSAQEILLKQIPSLRG
jgi:hypothetical protein